MAREVDEEHLSILEESARATQETAIPPATGGLREKVLVSIGDLQRGLLERETEVSSTGRRRHLPCRFLSGPVETDEDSCILAWPASKTLHLPLSQRNNTTAVLLLSVLYEARPPLAISERLLTQVSSFEIGAAHAVGSAVWRAPAAAGPARHSQVRAEPSAEPPHRRPLL